MTVNPEALANLRDNQRQLDADGTEVGVSRQALNEVLEAFADPAPLRVPLLRRTHTYATTDIAIHGGFIYAQDFGHETGPIEVPDRVASVLDAKHLRKFGTHQGDGAMYHFTMWLHDVGAVVGHCYDLPETLTDAERQP